MLSPCRIFAIATLVWSIGLPGLAAEPRFQDETPSPSPAGGLLVPPPIFPPPSSVSQPDSQAACRPSPAPPLPLNFFRQPDLQNDRLIKIAIQYASLGEQRQAAQLIQKVNSNLQKIGAYLEIADRSLEAGQQQLALDFLAEAVKVAPRLQDPSDKTRSLIEIAKKFVKAGESSQAIQAIQLTKNQFFEDRITVEIAKKLIQEGQLTQAINTVQDLQPGNASALSEIAVSIAEQYIKTGQGEQAFQFLQSIQIQCLRDATKPKIAKRLAEAGQLSLALLIMQTFDKNTFEKDQVLAAIAIKLATMQQFPQALQVANSIQVEVEKARVLTEISIAYIMAGQGEQSLPLIAQALQITQRVGEQEQKFNALADISISFARAGQPDRAKDFLSQAVKQFKAFPYLLVQQEWIDMAAKFTKAQQLSLAFEVVETFKDGPLGGAALRAIATQLAEAKQFSQALQVADTIINDTDKGLALIQIASKYLASGEKQQALQLLAKAEQLSQTSEAVDRVAILTEVAHQLTKAEQSQQASEMLSKALDLTQNPQPAAVSSPTLPLTPTQAP